MSYTSEITGLDCPRCGEAKLKRETEIDSKCRAVSLFCNACWFREIEDFESLKSKKLQEARS